MDKGIGMCCLRALEKCLHICHCFDMDLGNMRLFPHNEGPQNLHNTGTHTPPETKIRKYKLNGL